MDHRSWISAAYISALFVTWIASWLLVRRFASPSLGRARHRLLIVHHALATLPFVWLLAFSTLVLRAYLRVGDWPHGGQHDSRGLLVGAVTLACLVVNADPVGVLEWLDG